MSRAPMFAALDLGSDTIKLALASEKERGKRLELLELRQIKARGVRRGVVENSEQLAACIKELVAGAEKTVNRKIREVIVNVGGGHIFIKPSRGVVAVSRADRQISEEDIERVIAAAQALSLPANKEVLNLRPVSFTVDGDNNIHNPVGMKGTRLEADILAICGFSPYIKNLTEAVAKCDLDVIELVPSAVAAAEAVLNVQQKELGVAVLDIGAWTTNLAVYEEGELNHLAVFPVGAGHITNDIAIGLQTEIDVAEEIKRKYGSCVLGRSGPQKIGMVLKQTVEPEQADLPTPTEAKKIKLKPKRTKVEYDLVFSRKLLTKIIEARVKQIFNEVNKELKHFNKAKNLPAGLVLTGGGAKLEGLAELGKKEFKLPCKVSCSGKISGTKEDCSLSVVSGLLLKNFDDEERLGMGEGRSLFAKLRGWLKVFVP